MSGNRHFAASTMQADIVGPFHATRNSGFKEDVNKSHATLEWKGCRAAALPLDLPIYLPLDGKTFERICDLKGGVNLSANERRRLNCPRCTNSPALVTTSSSRGILFGINRLMSQLD